MNKETVQQRLSMPNGSEQLMINASVAFDAAWELFIEGFAPAGAFLCRCAKKKEYAQRIQAKLNPDRTTLSYALRSENAKLRKNAARLMGQLQDPADAQPLIEALGCEATLFVLPSIILALGTIGTNEAKQALEQYQEAAKTQNSASVQDKHAHTEQEALRVALAQFVSLQKHVFTQLAIPYPVELRAPEHLGQSLQEELIELKLPPTQIQGDCLRLQTQKIRELYDARCFTELLFPVAKGLLADGVLIAQKTSEVLRKLLCTSHSGKPPFGYRIEIRGDYLDRGELSHRIVSALDDEILCNSPGDYEVQLILEQGNNGFDAYIQLKTIQDDRFSYRIGVIAASMHPATAAAVLRYATKLWVADGYVMARDARVLDPTCGSGTFLIERGKLSPCRALTGVDISHKAIDIARVNADAAGQRAAFIVNDCLRFIAKEPYDELIANLPFDIRVGSHENNEQLYTQILSHFTEWVRPGGVALLYTMEFALLRRLLIGQKKMRLLSEIRSNAGSPHHCIFVLRVL